MIIQLIKKCCLPIFVFIFISCETEFEPNIVGESVPVIYGIYHLPPHEMKFNGLNYPLYLEAPNYIKIMKTFAGGRSAWDMAKISDSLYYQNAKVEIEYYCQGGLIKTSELIRTDEINKESGIFSTNNNILYKTTNHIIPHGFDTLRLRIELPDDKTVFATTPYVSVPTILKPVFISENHKEIGFYYDDPFEIYFRDRGDYYTITMAIHLIEIKSGLRLEKTINWQRTFYSEKVKDFFDLDWVEFDNHFFDNYTSLDKSVIKKNPIFKSIYYFEDDFYKYIAGNVTRDPAIKRRGIKSLDIVVTATDKILRDYMELQKSTIDNGEVITNIQNGIGIFVSACSTAIYNIKLDRESVDSLVGGRFTKHLGFVTYLIGE